MASATARVTQPGNEKGRLAGRPSPISSLVRDITDNTIAGAAQLLPFVPRIIATHWLRVEQVEEANG